MGFKYWIIELVKRFIFWGFDVLNAIFRLPYLGNALMFIFRRAIKKSSTIPGLRTISNWGITHYFATSAPVRPHPYSLWSSVKKNPHAYPTPTNGPPKTQAPWVPTGSYGPVSNYTCWPALTNKQFSARHMPPTENNQHPDLDAVVKLFQRANDDQPTKDRSSVLFMFFAQWFTDSFSRVDSKDRRKNTSNHDIDLCPIYGLDEKTCRRLRTKVDGKLKSQLIAGEEYLPYLGTFTNGVWQVKHEFRNMPYVNNLANTLGGFSKATWRWEKLYATGLERGNSNIGYVAISTLFMREHNKIAGILVNAYKNDPTWQAATDPVYFDERVFQTARMINTVILLKIVVEDYINHVSGTKSFTLDHTFAEQQRWYRTNWVTIEFDLLYRWHGTVRNKIFINNKDRDHSEYRFNNNNFEAFGLATIFTDASKQQCGKIGLKNTPSFLWEAEALSLKMSRDFKLKTYNEYREWFSLQKLTSFKQLTDDPILRKELEDVYGHIDKVEYLVGIFAEKRKDKGLLGRLMFNMVAYDAFTHIYTNPLLSKNVYGPQSFTEEGMKIINSTNSLQDLVARNVSGNVNASFGCP